MPRLTDERNTKKIILPSSVKDDEAWVIIYTDVLTEDIMAVQSGEDAAAGTVSMLGKLIKEWNFTDKEGKPAPITMENLRRLKAVDLAAIIDESGAMEQLSRLNLTKKKT